VVSAGVMAHCVACPIRSMSASGCSGHGCCATRGGPAEALMHGVVQRLTIDDMLAIAAYVASREP